MWLKRGEFVKYGTIAPKYGKMFASADPPYLQGLFSFLLDPVHKLTFIHNKANVGGFPDLFDLIPGLDAEAELARLRKEVESIPERLKKEVEEAATHAAASTAQKFEQQLVLLKKDAEAEKRLSELQIKSLNETVMRQASEIESLQRQVDEAKRQVQDIAVKAIEGASGASALAHVNKIAMEQAKTRSPQS